MPHEVSLIEYLKTQPEVYCECPFCQEVFRLNEARLTYGRKARKDLLDRMRRLREELDARLTEARVDARKRSRAISKGLMIEHICPYLPTFNHHPRDARFLGDPIDFIIFDDLFSKQKVTNLTIAEVKSGNSQLTSTRRKASKKRLTKEK